MTTRELHAMKMTGRKKRTRAKKYIIIYYLFNKKCAMSICLHFSTYRTHCYLIDDILPLSPRLYNNYIISLYIYPNNNSIHGKIMKWPSLNDIAEPSSNSSTAKKKKTQKLAALRLRL